MTTANGGAEWVRRVAGATRLEPLPARRTATSEDDTPGSLSVLLVEDNPGDAELMAEMLEDGPAEGPVFELRHVTRLADAQVELVSGPVDVVLLDLSLPDGRGLESLAVVRQAAPEVPVVVMTGLADDEVAVRALQAGAQDYLVKGREGGDSVRRAVRYAVERQRLARMAQQALAARDEMLAILSHDLRSPIGIVGMCAQALLDPEPTPPDSAREMGVIIERSCDWMLRLISDLLDVTRLEAGMLPVHMRSVPVRVVAAELREMFAPLATEKGVTFRLSLADDLPHILADNDRLLQALGNLVGNAIKFTSAGGSVALDVEQTQGEDGRPGVLFRLADTGQGIPPEALAHVFDRFWQAHNSRRSGAGLGLAIARGIVEAHGGRIAVTSEVGVGTTFTCTFQVDGTAPG